MLKPKIKRNQVFDHNRQVRELNSLNIRQLLCLWASLTT